MYRIVQLGPSTVPHLLCKVAILILFANFLFMLSVYFVLILILPVSFATIRLSLIQCFSSFSVTISAFFIVVLFPPIFFP